MISRTIIFFLLLGGLVALGPFVFSRVPSPSLCFDSGVAVGRLLATNPDAARNPAIAKAEKACGKNQP